MRDGPTNGAQSTAAGGGGRPWKEVSHGEQGWVTADWGRGPGEDGSARRPGPAAASARQNRRARVCSPVGPSGPRPLPQAVLWGWAAGPTRCPWLSGDSLQVGARCGRGVPVSAAPQLSPATRENEALPALARGSGRVQGSRAPCAGTPAPMLNDFLTRGCRAEWSCAQAAELSRIPEGLPAPHGSFALAFILPEEPSGATSRAASPRPGFLSTPGCRPKTLCRLFIAGVSCPPLPHRPQGS